tara:strand:+ start:407 stop:586 length:180 start_codon:yes stop_codon:yes gene_type:complete
MLNLGGTLGSDADVTTNPTVAVGVTLLTRDALDILPLEVGGSVLSGIVFGLVRVSTAGE